MTPEQIRLVKSSWASVILIAEEAGSMFYKRLFEIAPEVRPMFKHDMASQERKLTDMITYVVANLDKLKEIAGDVKELGSKHKVYGATAEHYKIVGECLIWTLEKGMDDKWNKDLETAWLSGYTILADAMMEGNV
ncbi:MAG: hemin receptor [Opitutaceae bacterium]|nr:hemin receptor [Cytophagales bacterium]